jgi:hypothetical protein
MPEQTMPQTCVDIDDLHRQVADLTRENGELRAQHHDLVRAKEAACQDARTLRDELKATKTEFSKARAGDFGNGW